MGAAASTGISTGDRSRRREPPISPRLEASASVQRILKSDSVCIDTTILVPNGLGNGPLSDPGASAPEPFAFQDHDGQEGSRPAMTQFQSLRKLALEQAEAGKSNADIFDAILNASQHGFSSARTSPPPQLYRTHTHYAQNENTDKATNHSHTSRQRGPHEDESFSNEAQSKDQNFTGEPMSNGSTDNVDYDTFQSGAGDANGHQEDKASQLSSEREKSGKKKQMPPLRRALTTTQHRSSVDRNSISFQPSQSSLQRDAKGWGADMTTYEEGAGGAEPKQGRLPLRHGSSGYTGVGFIPLRRIKSLPNVLPTYALSLHLSSFDGDAWDDRASVIGGVGRHLRRARIFEKGPDQGQLLHMMKRRASITPGSPTLDKMDKEVRDVILRTVQDFFFMDDDGSDRQIKLLLEAMQMETLQEGRFLMRQGEEGRTMYVIQAGTLDVIIDGKLRRTVGAGDKVGELSLLYNAPRSASIRAKTSCTLWSIGRDVFKEVQAFASMASLAQRSSYLKRVPCLSVLDNMDLCKLAGALETTTYANGEVILEIGSCTDRCILVEAGCVSASSTNDKNDAENPCATVESLVLCTRPRARGAAVTRENTRGVRTPRGSASPRGSGGSVQLQLPDLERDEQKEEKEDAGDHFMSSSCLSTADSWNEETGAVTYDKGCFLGVPVMLAAGGLEIEGLRPWEVQEPNEDDSDGPVVAISPVRFIAVGHVRLSYFTISSFQCAVGSPLSIALAPSEGAINAGWGGKSVKLSPKRLNKSGRSRTQRELSGAFDLHNEILTADSFIFQAFLGQGSFGHVTLVKKKDGAMAGERFALKVLNKQAIVDGGQLSHIKGEIAALTNLHHPFLLHLFATFQTRDYISMLTEPVIGGELWSVLYEGRSGCGTEGLPPDHCQFYTAVVSEALLHMHSKGIAYRDLKPENLVIDAKGYLRLIDMGFAKRIPFVVTGDDGEVQVFPRSHTMCGTPEYLAPEFIFGKGHDQRADDWALGVLSYELVAGHTPFVGTGKDVDKDMTMLFTNIASVKKRGVPFSPNFGKAFQSPDGLAHCKSFICALLQFDPSKRLGNTPDLLRRHPYFTALKWEDLRNKVIDAPWIPPGLMPSAAEEGMGDAFYLPYRGDPAAFAEF